MRLEGRVAIVTGAGSGIGEAVVRRFVREGARVAACDIAFPAVQSLSAELTAAGHQVHPEK